MAIRDHGFDRLGLDRLVSIIHRDNLASRRVAEKAGLRPERMIQFMNHRCWLYAIEAPDRSGCPGEPSRRSAGGRSTGPRSGCSAVALVVRRRWGRWSTRSGSRCDWLVVALVRALVMLATAATLARASGSRLAFWRPRTLWVRSLAGSFSLVCNFYALTRLPVADAVTLSTSTRSGSS